jgi:hypothetical protein
MARHNEFVDHDTKSCSNEWLFEWLIIINTFSALTTYIPKIINIWNKK